MHLWVQEVEKTQMFFAVQYLVHFFLRKRMLRVIFNLLGIDTILNKQSFLREEKVSVSLL